MADQKKQFTKVNQLRPLDTGLNLIVKVVNAKTVVQRGRTQGRFAECLVGDETGIIIFSARNDQGCVDEFMGSDFEERYFSALEFGPAICVDLAKEGNTLVLSNAKIDMFKGSMRLAVDRSGRVEVGDPASFTVEESNNLSLIEFERIDVVV